MGNLARTITNPMSNADSGETDRSHPGMSLKILPHLVALMLIGVIGGPSTVLAATIAAANCSSNAVSTAINQAVDGDTVLIPAGDCTWSTQVLITEGIKLIGAGQASTILRDAVPKNGGPQSTMLQFNVAAPHNFEASHFKVIWTIDDPYNKGHISISGTSKAFRLHHITYANAAGTTNQGMGNLVASDGYLWGLIDHITVNGYGGLLVCQHAGWNGSSWGDGSWAEEAYWGTEKAIYIEDSSVNATYVGPPVAAFDAYAGCRAVLRHNTFNGALTGSHGLDSSQRRRAVRTVELYDNTYRFISGTTPDFVHWFRGGTGVMFNNTVTADSGSLNHMAKHTNLRDTGSYTPWGQCNGTNVYDGNTTGQNGWPCADQPGAGTSRDLGGLGTPTAASFNNISDPIYVWNNKLNGSANNCATWSCFNDNNVKYGRDIIFGTPRPGYVPYIYPHPLQNGTGASAPSAPKNLSVS